MQSTRENRVEPVCKRRAVCLPCAMGGRPTCVCGAVAELSGPDTVPYTAPAAVRVIALSIRVPPPTSKPPATEPTGRRRPAHRKASGRKQRGGRHSSAWSTLRRLLRRGSQAAAPQQLRAPDDRVRGTPMETVLVSQHAA